MKLKRAILVIVASEALLVIGLACILAAIPNPPVTPAGTPYGPGCDNRNALFGCPVGTSVYYSAYSIGVGFLAVAALGFLFSLFLLKELLSPKKSVE